MSEDHFLNRDRVQCLVNELQAILNAPTVESVVIRFDKDKITLLPFVQKIEITL